MSTSRTNVASSPGRPVTSGSYSSIVARPIVGSNNANHPPFEPRIIRATSSPAPPVNPIDTTCLPNPTPPATARVRRPSTGRHTNVTASSASHIIRPVLTPNASIPAPSGGASLHASPQAFPRPAYLDHSAFRDLIRTNATVPVQFTEPLQVQRTLTGTTSNAPIPAPYPYLRRALSPAIDSDDEGSASPPPPAVSNTTSSKGIWSGKATFPLPTRWSEMDRHASLSISADGRDLTFCGPSCPGDRDSAAARANEPIPPACGIYYYEVEILHKGNKGHISIGFSCNDVRLSRLPGWEKHSWGYHADDGWSFPGHREGNPYGPVFDSGDIIGCGVDFSQNRAFYTKNGTFLGMVFENVGTDLEVYPSVGLRHTGESIRVNFGHEPFRFAIEDHVHSAKNRVWSNIQSTPINWHVLRGESAKYGEVVEGKKAGTHDEDDDAKESLRKLVFGYLAHHGYLETAHAFKAQCEGKPTTMEDSEFSDARDDEEDMDMDEGPSGSLSSIDEERSLRTRVNIMNNVLKGNIDAALDQTCAHYPSVLEREQGLMLFKLRCRKFVELILDASEALKKVKSGDAASHERGRDTTVATKVDQEGGEMMDDGGAMDVDDPSPEAQTHTSNSPSLDVSSSTTSTTGKKETTSRSPSSSSTASSPSHSSSGSALAKAALHNALKYGQTLESDYKPDTRPEIRSHLKRTFGVVAYPDPLAVGGEVAEMAGQEARVRLANELNQAILESQGKPAHPALEMLYRQAAACVAELGTQGVGAAAFADMSREFLDS
ncbi:unnamed protein product [Somion occarium]